MVNKSAERQMLVEMLVADPRMLANLAQSVGIAALVPGGMTVAVRADTLPGDNVLTYGSLIEQIQGMLTSHHIGPPAKQKKKDQQ